MSKMDSRATGSRGLRARGSRKEPRVFTNKKILIVCEGEKTEPNYFRYLINEYKLSTASVVVTGECGSSPKGVFDEAKKLYKKEEKKGDPFDSVYCVFDRDEHSTFKSTCCNIKNRKKPANVFFCITSVPCFEYWLLLHYKETDSPFNRSQNKSEGDKVKHELKKFFPNYEKKSKEIFMAIIDKTDTAIKYAKRIIERSGEEYSNPSTEVYKLVELLLEMKEVKRRR